jgi:4-coumarate--CoA ligase
MTALYLPVCLLGLQTFSPNHIYMPVAYLGVLSCGAIFSGLNPAYTAEGRAFSNSSVLTIHPRRLPLIKGWSVEAAFQISNAGANLILVHPDLVQTAKAAAKKANLSADRLFLFADQEVGTVDGIHDWREILASSADGNAWKWKSLSPEEAVTQVATLNFSSGTTGLPKGVCISHKSLISNVLQLQQIYDLSKPKRWVGFLPLYHAYGQCFMILIAARYRIPVFIMKAFQLEEYLRIIETHRITSLQIVPPILIMLEKRPEVARYDLSSVQEILCAAAPLSGKLQQAMIDKLSITVTQAYGTTETTCGVFCNPWHYSEKPIGCVGVPLPNTEVKLLDDNGRDVAVGERGEVYCRGPQVALRYWHNEQASKDSFDEEGWYKTGDVGTVNEKGFFWIVDRKKELIKVKGLQVSPAELEAVLWASPDVADAAVAGITL